MMATMVPAASASARWAERYGVRAVLSTGLVLVAAGLSILAGLGTTTSYWQLAAGLVVLGIGMGNVAAPATGAVMTSLPVAKAGVGSAVNDTAREVGGALGIAVLGSIVASRFTNGLDAGLAGLPPASVELAQVSVGAALAVAGELGGGAGAALADAARGAYTDAMSAALAVAAGVGVLAALGVRRWLPPHAPDSHETVPDTTDRRTAMPISTGFNHIATMTADLDRAVAFYTTIFEATVTDEIHRSDDHPRMVILDLGGGSALNVAETGPDTIVGDRRTAGGRGPIDHYGIAVGSRATLDAVRNRLETAGADIGEVHHLGDIWSLFFRDPDGMELEVCAPLEDPDTTSVSADVEHPDQLPGHVPAEVGT